MLRLDEYCVLATQDVFHLFVYICAISVYSKNIGKRHMQRPVRHIILETFRLMFKEPNKTILL